jgi:hypothetical protein
MLATMLATLTMLPPPLAAIRGASAATRKYGARTLLSNSAPYVATSRSAVGPNQEKPALVDENVDLTGLVGEAAYLGRVGQVGRDEACLPACA